VVASVLCINVILQLSIISYLIWLGIVRYSLIYNNAFKVPLWLNKRALQYINKVESSMVVTILSLMLIGVSVVSLISLGVMLDSWGI
jgi:hypothetical protein